MPYRLSRLIFPPKCSHFEQTIATNKVQMWQLCDVTSFPSWCLYRRLGASSPSRRLLFTPCFNRHSFSFWFLCYYYYFFLDLFFLYFLLLVCSVLLKHLRLLNQFLGFSLSVLRLSSFLTSSRYCPVPINDRLEPTALFFAFFFNP